MQLAAVFMSCFHVRAAVLWVVSALVVLPSVRASVAPSEAAEPVQAAPLIFRGDHQFPPYEFISDGKPKGFNIDLLRAIADVMDLSVEIDLGPWNEVRADLESGRIDGITGMFYSEQRDRVVDFTMPHTIVSHTVFVRVGSPIRSFADVRGKAILVQDGDIMCDYVRAQSLSDTIVAVPDLIDALELLSAGRYDCALVAELQGQYMIRTYGIGNVHAVGGPILPQHYCLAVAEGREDLRAQLNKGLGLLKTTGQYRAIYEKWFGVIGPPTILSRIAAYAPWVAGVSAFLLIGLMMWSWSLRQQVAARTGELKTELAGRQRLATELEAKNLELEQVIYITSHDLRSPLVNIHGFAQELARSCGRVGALLADAGFDDTLSGELDAVLTQEIPEAQHYIDTSIRKMDALLNGLLQLSRIGRMELAIQTVDMNGLLLRTVDGMRYQIDSAGARVMVGDLPPCRGDREQLGQVFSNLLDNALKYGAAERVCEIHVSGTVSESTIIYCVSDNGQGIESDLVAKAFEPFHRLNPKDGAPGIGVGLAIVKRIVERHGGCIWVESEVGGGSRFHVAVPHADGDFDGDGDLDGEAVMQGPSGAP